MQRRRTTILGTALLLCGVCTATSSLAAVHGGGVGACATCHAMHPKDQSGGITPGPGPGTPGSSLLAGGPASDICLSCHATAYGAVLGPSPLAPPAERGPGNFVFLLEDNLNDGPDGVTNPIIGDQAGHNVNAPAHGLSSDGTYLTSPGGTYPSNNLKCTSCHDPHGNRNYRFLRGPGTQEGSGGIFIYDAPVATGLDLETGGSESNTNHVAYLSGMSLWCGNCHAAYLNDHDGEMGGMGGMGGFDHPTDDTFDSGELNWYNSYNGTADPTGGSPSTAYLAAVPFQDAANTNSSTAGPTSSSRIMCLTCHRAHASSGPSSGRWDFNVTTLGQDGVVSGSYPIPNPYGDPNQDPLCRKCHDSHMHH